MAISFTVDVDADRFARWKGVETEAARESLALQVAADISESPALAETGAHLTWHRLGGRDIPHAVRYAGETGRSIRDQMAIDDDQKWE